MREELTMSCDPLALAAIRLFESEGDGYITLFARPEQKVGSASFRPSFQTHLRDTVHWRALSQGPCADAIQEFLYVCRSISISPWLCGR